ncbi:Nte1p [Savitreella phatthalungensis]
MNSTVNSVDSRSAADTLLDGTLKLISQCQAFFWITRDLLRTIISSTLILRLNFFTLLLLTLALGLFAWHTVRTRYLKNYAKLSAAPIPREQPADLLFPETIKLDTKPGLHNYLDDFLSAIKVFGYLERPVFQELTRHMYTKKVLAGETLNLEDEQSFCLLIDGHVQVFSRQEKPGGNSNVATTSEDGSDAYRLLTDVRNGAPLSSMFTILSLFTEDIKLRQKAEEAAADSPQHQQPTNHFKSEVDVQQLPEPHTPDTIRMSPVVRGVADSPRMHIADKQGLLLERPSARARKSTSNLSEVPHFPLLNPPAAKKRRSVHPGIVARATIDSTIAVIPAEAFRRLTRIYPKAAAHIVQVIMTRYQRVTFAIGHNYLGLTAEILSTEKSMNDLTSYELPNFVRASSMESMKDKLQRAAVTSRDGAANHGDAVVVSSPAPRRAGRDFKGGASGKSRRQLLRPLGTLREVDATSDAVETDTASDSGKSKLAASDAEDRAFRDSVLHCIFRSLGLEQHGQTQQLKSNPGSVEQSPRLAPQDHQSQKASRSNFGNAISNMMFDLNALGAGGSEVESESAFTSNSVEGIDIDLDNDLEIVHYVRDSVLVETQESSPGLFYVIDGFLEVGVVEKSAPLVTTLGPEHNSQDRTDETINPFDEEFGDDSGEASGERFCSLYTVKPGGIAGYQAGLGNHRSFVDIRAKTDVLVGFLPRASLERIMEQRPVVLLTMAKRLISLLSPLILHLDFALGWMQIEGGQTLYKQNDEADSIYVVLNGRVRGIRQRSSDETDLEVSGEFGNGESVGELEVLTDSTRPFTLNAVRETELARFPKELFQSLAMEHPAITMKISKLMARRMFGLLQGRSASDDVQSGQIFKTSSNLRTIAILPMSQDVPLSDFATRLSHGLLELNSSVAMLDHAAILSHLGRHAFSRIGKLRLAGHLADLEERFDKLLYVADSPASSAWSQTCVSQADCILLVGLASSDSAISEYEKLVLSLKTTARKELVLLHSERGVVQGLSRAWLKDRKWLNAHHHLEMDTISPLPSARPRAALRTLTTIKRKIKNVQSELSRYAAVAKGQSPDASSQHPSHSHDPRSVKNDYARLARRICGQSIGLVLGGGGARGLAHIGVLKAIEEAGIPVDIVGGTSIGSFIGGLYALDGDIVPMFGRAKRFSSRMAGLWRFALDLTYPTVSYTSGHEFNRGIWKAFGQAQIEDFWLPYFANSTNITHSRMDFHMTGYAWRYIRASMSLAGLVPPMEDNGDMLCDGGYVDNLPVAKMRSLGARYIFAVDVGSVDEKSVMAYGDTLSGFWAVLNRWNPFSTHPNIPTLTDIQSRLAYSASVPALEKAKKMADCHYMRPPIAEYGTLEFGKFDEIYQVGYEYGKEFLRKAIEEGRFDNLPVRIITTGTKSGSGPRRQKPSRRNSRPSTSAPDVALVRERRNSL